MSMFNEMHQKRRTWTRAILPLATVDPLLLKGALAVLCEGVDRVMVRALFCCGERFVEEFVETSSMAGDPIRLYQVKLGTRTTGFR